MIKYIIIDDEFIAHDIIKGYADLLPNLKFMQSCNDAIEALEYLNHYQVDLMFLDLNMPKLKGFEFLKTLQNPPQVIVTTAYKEFALEGYELNVIDYLLKPFSFERFLKAVNKAAGKSVKKEVAVSDYPHQKSVFFRSQKQHIQVDVDDILLIEASGNYCKVVTLTDIVTVREKISDILNRLPVEKFMQVHKSFAIAKQHVKLIEGNRIQIQDHLIPIGKMYKVNVSDLLK